MAAEALSNSFNDALTSVLRFQSMQEELTQARLEREEWDTNRGFRMRMNELTEQKSKSALALDELNQKLLQSQLAQAELEQPERLKGLKAETDLRTAQAEQVRAEGPARLKNLDLEGKNLQSGIDQNSAQTDAIRSNTALAQLAAAGTMGAGMGRAGSITLEDASVLADQLMESLGVKSTPANKSVYVNRIFSEGTAISRELQETRALNERNRLEADTDEAVKIFQATSQLDNPLAAIEGMAEAYKDRPRVMQIAKEFAKQQVGMFERQQKSALAREAAGFRDKYTDTIGEEIATHQATIARLGAKKLTSSSDKEQLEKAKAALPELQKNLSEYLDKRFPGLSKVPTASTSTLTADELRKVPEWLGQATDDQLVKLSRATNIPLDKLKLERDRRARTRGE